MRKEPAYGSVTRLMVCYGALFLGRNDFALALHTTYYPVNCVEEILSFYKILVFSGSNQGCFVTNVCNICTRKPGSLLCKEVNIKPADKLKIAKMHFKNLETFLQFREIQVYLTVKTTCPHQCLVEDIRPVGGCQDNDSGV